MALLPERISGIPMLERRVNERWGPEPALREDTKQTPVLIPRPSR
jgi:hypothetical protein